MFVVCLILNIIYTFWSTPNTLFKGFHYKGRDFPSTEHFDQNKGYEYWTFSPKGCCWKLSSGAKFSRCLTYQATDLFNILILWISYPILYLYQEKDIISLQYPKNLKDIYQISYILIKYEAQSKPVLTKNFIAPRNHFHLSTT